MRSLLILAVLLVSIPALAQKEREVESAELDDGENRINFKVSLVLAGEQDVERPFNGDELNLIP